MLALMFLSSIPNKSKESFYLGNYVLNAPIANVTRNSTSLMSSTTVPWAKEDDY
jgi:hypothetical protein